MPRHLLVVSHRVKTTPEEEEIIGYANERAAGHVLYIFHSFASAPDRRSGYRWYHDGVLLRQGQTRDYRRMPESGVYAKEAAATLRWAWRPGVAWNRYVGMDGLCTLFGLALRAAGRARNVTFWNLDFVPQGRFASTLKSRAYERVNRYAALHADEVWDHNELMTREKERVLGLRPSDYRRHRVVPLGVRAERVRRHRYEESERHTLVYMGSLLEKNGVQVALRAVPQIRAALPDFRFRVIGGGEFEPELRRLAAELGVESAVDFTGRIERHEDLEAEVARCALAVAPYVRDVDTSTQFGGEAAKVKVYLACGVPVLLTDAAWIAADVARLGCGAIIEPDPEQIGRQVIAWLSDGEANQRAREAAAALAETFDSRRMFDAIGV